MKLAKKLKTHPVEADPGEGSHPSFLIASPRPYAPPPAKIAPFLHHSCTVKRNSKLYRETPCKVLLRSQPIVSEQVVSDFDQGKTFLGKETVKFWMLYQPLMSTRQIDGKVLVKFYESAVGKKGLSQPGSYLHSHRPCSISARPLPISAFRFQFSAFTLSLSRRAPKTGDKWCQKVPKSAKSCHPQ